MKKYQFHQFTATRLYGNAVSYSPDGKTIAYVDNTTGQFNLWTMPSGGGIPRQLTTFSDNTVRDLRWSPDSKTIAFNADHDGDEFVQIYLIDAAGSWPEQITHKADARFYLGDWSPDGSAMLFTANDDNPQDMDTLIRDMKTGEVRRMVTGALNFAVRYSPNGKYATVNRIYGNTNQDILVMEVDSGETALATPHEGDIIFSPGPWAKDNSGFYFVTNQGREYNGVAFYSMGANGSGCSTPITILKT